MLRARRVELIVVALVLIVAVSAVAFRYRDLLLSKLNVYASGNAAIIGLRQVADIPLDGGTTRFDYQSLDPQRGLLFIAHLGAGQVIVFDVKQQKVIATIPTSPVPMV